MNTLWHRSMMKFVGVSYRILKANFKFEKAKKCDVEAFGPSEEGEDE